ncbi:hypothetical protein F5884DRAFT_166887 [Xylogone sp. PMI_703]|nr:hypothetical protein F5884DRAFT_166887 [Xylogone sp. PMI_703]
MIYLMMNRTIVDGGNSSASRSASKHPLFSVLSVHPHRADCRCTLWQGMQSSGHHRRMAIEGSIEAAEKLQINFCSLGGACPCVPVTTLRAHAFATPQPAELPLAEWTNRRPSPGRRDPPHPNKLLVPQRFPSRGAALASGSSSLIGCFNLRSPSPRLQRASRPRCTAATRGRHTAPSSLGLVSCLGMTRAWRFPAVACESRTGRAW